MLRWDRFNVLISKSFLGVLPVVHFAPWLGSSFFHFLSAIDTCRQGPKHSALIRKSIHLPFTCILSVSSHSSATDSHTYTEMDEARFLKRNRAIHPARLFLSILIFSTAIAIIACEAVTVQDYKSTSQWASSGLALWPLNYDNRPTVAALSCGCVIASLSLIYIVAALLPTVSLSSLHMLLSKHIELTLVSGNSHIHGLVF